MRNHSNKDLGGSGKHDESYPGMDYSYSAILETRRLAWGGRSVSLDYLHEQPTTDTSSVLSRGRPVPSLHSKYEAADDPHAAPEPMVAGGPRKLQDPMATGPLYVNSTSGKPNSNTLRKVTTQTDLRSSNQSTPVTIPQEIRDQAADFVRTSTMRGTPTVPSFTEAIGGAEPVKLVTSRKKDPSPAQEKQGFFKRVFGGGSSRTVSSSSDKPAPPQNSRDAVERPQTTTRAAAPASAGSQNRNESNPSTSAVTSYPPPALSKKPSSFFRRRKKSTSETSQPPPLPVGVGDANLNFKTAQPSSSISSLRQVMDPYLGRENNAVSQRLEKTSESNAYGSDSDDSDDLDIFHVGYTPPPDASLGARHPLSRESTVRSTPNPQTTSKKKIKIKKRRPEPVVTKSLEGKSFLHDPSTNPSTATLPGIEPASISPLWEHAFDDKENKQPSSRPSTGDHIIESEASRMTAENKKTSVTNALTNEDSSSKGESWLLNPVSSLDRSGSKKLLDLNVPPKASKDQRADGNGSISPMDVFGKPSLPAIASQLGMSIDISKLQALSAPSDNDAQSTERARKIFEGDEEDVSKSEAAAWMGERNALSTSTLQAYMQLFDFSGLNILAALRMLCGRLVLRGETQQFDRIITALSARWCECNPNHGLRAQDVVHTIIYSLILLNTDLHLADIGEKMSRSAYVKNTLPTIKRVAADAAPTTFDETMKPSSFLSARPSLPWMGSAAQSPTSPLSPQSDTLKDQASLEAGRPTNLSVNVDVNRSLTRPSFSRADSDGTGPDSATGGVSNALVSNPWNGSLRGWEAEIETMLKSFFMSIRSDPLPLHGSAVAGLATIGERNLSALNVNGNFKLSGSTLNRAPSETMSLRSKYDLRSRWQSRTNRSRPKLYSASTFESSRSSFDDGSGFWSPTQSSKFSFNKTLTSASVGSLGYHSSMRADSYKHSIGFANALSQAIIREEAAGASDTESFSVPHGLLEDEALELQGAPWAKEGLVKHKHHLETPERKAKDRNWTDCFAVISKGKMTLFAFNTSTKSQSNTRKGRFHRPGRALGGTTTTVGGGDWMENAEQLDVFVLRQTIASTLPPPGYSSTRPHVWALSLPSGAVHLFQVGTPEIAAEFMSTANYWSARLSKEPLSGGVSNIEYGWSDGVINPALVGGDHRPNSVSVPTPPSSVQTRQVSHGHSVSIDRAGRPSLQSSIRNSFDTGLSGVKARLPADKLHIAEWKPPTQSMMASQLMEVDQLKQLLAYVINSEEELSRHNELKHAIELAVSFWLILKIFISFLSVQCRRYIHTDNQNSSHPAIPTFTKP